MSRVQAESVPAAVVATPRPSAGARCLCGVDALRRSNSRLASNPLPHRKRKLAAPRSLLDVSGSERLLGGPRQIAAALRRSLRALELRSQRGRLLQCLRGPARRTRHSQVRSALRPDARRRPWRRCRSPCWNPTMSWRRPWPPGASAPWDSWPPCPPVRWRQGWGRAALRLQAQARGRVPPSAGSRRRARRCAALRKHRAGASGGVAGAAAVSAEPDAGAGHRARRATFPGHRLDGALPSVLDGAPAAGAPWPRTRLRSSGKRTDEASAKLRRKIAAPSAPRSPSATLAPCSNSCSLSWRCIRPPPPSSPCASRRIPRVRKRRSQDSSRRRLPSRDDWRFCWRACASWWAKAASAHRSCSTPTRPKHFA